MRFVLLAVYTVSFLLACSAWLITDPPVRGFNSWVAFGCGVTDAKMREVADAIVALNLTKVYPIVALDDCWALENRSSDGKLVPDPKAFPYGMKNLSSYITSLQLSFGIYTSIGTTTCAERAGSAFHEDIDAATFSEWNVSFIKADNCNRSKVNPSGSWTVDTAVLYQRWAAALAKQPRPITLATKASINYSIALEVGQSRRVAFDISANFHSILLELYMAIPLWSQGHPGNRTQGTKSFWTDIELVVVGLGRLTPAENRFHFYSWCALHAPLLLSTPVNKVDADALSVISNLEAIDIDQDGAGSPARRVQLDLVADAQYSPGPLSALTCSDSLVMPGQAFEFVRPPPTFTNITSDMFLLKQRDGPAAGPSAGLCVQAAKCDSQLTLAPCPTTPAGVCQQGRGALWVYNAHSTQDGPEVDAASLPTGTLQSALALPSAPLCISTRVPSVTLAPCSATSPWDHYTYDNQTGQLYSVSAPPQDFNGYHICLDTTPQVHVETLAGPLSSNRFSVLVLNPSVVNTTITVAWANVSPTGVAPFNEAGVRDVDRHADLGVFQDGIALNVDAHGARLLVVTPI